MRNSLYILAALVALATLGACGGGGDDASGPSNSAPVLLDDVAATVDGSTITLDILRGDTDPDGDPIMVTDLELSDAAAGAATIAGDGQSIDFVAQPGFTGEVTITYTVEDDQGNSSTATVTLNIVASASLVVVSGDTQENVSGAALDNPFVLEVQDDQGMPLPGAYVDFDVLTGNGTLSTGDTIQIADAMGRVSTTLTLGDLGANEVRASMIGVPGTQTFTATALAGPSITTLMFADGETGSSYLGAPLAGTGGIGAYTFARIGGDEFPNSFSLSSDGVLSGNPDSGDDGDYTFQIEITDSQGNKATSNLPFTINDGIAPSAPTNFTASYSGNLDTVILGFDAPGDDATSGTATSYLIRSSGSPIADAGDFAAATELAHALTPAQSGTTQSVEIDATWYAGDLHFAVQALDEDGNAGAISASFMIDTDASADFGNTNISFGTVGIGSSASASAVITNSSSLVDLKIMNPSLATATNFAILLGGSDQDLAPNQSHTISMQFTAPSANTFNDTLNVTHNATNLPSPHSYMLSGVGSNAGPSVQTAVASPSSIVAGGTTTLTVVAVDSDSTLPGTNDITSVELDLSAFGGASDQAMNFDGQSGTPQAGSYSFSLMVPAQQNPTSYMIPVVVTDSSMATANAMISVTVTPIPNGLPMIAAASWSPASIPVGGMSTLTVRVSDSDSDFGNSTNDIASVVADLSNIMGSAAQAMTFDSNTDNTTGEYTFVFTAGSLSAQAYTVSIVATDSGSDTDSQNAVLTIVNSAPTITAATFTPSTVENNTTTTLDVTVTDIDSTMSANDISQVQIDLSAMGGSATQGVAFLAMTNATTATYRASISAAAVTPNTYNLTITATDMGSASDTEMATLIVTQANVAPQIGSSSIDPAQPVQGEMVTITVNVTDMNSNNPTTNDVMEVKLDMTVLGLAPDVDMQLSMTGTAGTNSRYTHAFSSFGLPTGTFALPVTASDTKSASITSTVSVSFDPVGLATPELLYEYPQATSNGATVYSARNHKMVYVFSREMDTSSFRVADSGQDGRTVMVFGMTGTPTTSFATGIEGMTGRILVVDQNTFQSNQTVNSVLMSDRLQSPGVGQGLLGDNDRALNPGHGDSFFSIFTFNSNPYGTCIGFQWAGTTVTDSSAPTVTSTTPAASSSNAGPRSPIRISFNEEIDPTTLASNFSVSDGMGNVSGTIHIDPSTLKDVWFQPTRDYSGQVNVNVNGVEDLGDNAASGTGFSFTHNTDSIAPTLTNLTVNGLPDHINGASSNGGNAPGGGIIRTSRNGFTIDFSYIDNGGSGVSLDKDDISVKCDRIVTGTSGAMGANSELIGQFSSADVLITRSGATLMVPSTLTFPNTGDCEITVIVKDVAGNSSNALSFTFEARDANNSTIPLENTETYHYVFDRDHETLSLSQAASNNLVFTGFNSTVAPDSKSDFDQSLEALGLWSTQGASNVNSGGGLSMNEAVGNWIRNRIVYYNYRYYGLNYSLDDGKPNPYFDRILNANPTNASDGVNVRFTITAAAQPITQARLAFGGAHTQGTLGLAAFDPKNNFHNEDNGVAVANTDRGVYTTHDVAREYDGTPSSNGAIFRSYMDPTSPFAAANGDPLGTDANDAFVVDPNQNPSTFTGTRLARYNQLLLTMDAFASQWGRVSAHEAGHSLGLIVNDAPGGGLYGGVAAYPGSTSGHVLLDSFYLGMGQNVMSPAGGLRQSYSRFTLINELALSYLLGSGLVN